MSALLCHASNCGVSNHRRMDGHTMKHSKCYCKAVNHTQPGNICSRSETLDNISNDLNKSYTCDFLISVHNHACLSPSMSLFSVLLIICFGQHGACTVSILRYFVLKCFHSTCTFLWIPFFLFFFLFPIPALLTVTITVLKNHTASFFTFPFGCIFPSS